MNHKLLDIMSYTEDQLYNKALKKIEKSEKSDDETGYKPPEEKPVVILDME